MSWNTFSNYNPNKDYELPQPPNDSVQTLSWSPSANYLVSGSWDCQLKIWEINSSYAGNVNAQVKISTNSEAPVLCTAWKTDGTMVFSGGCDNKAKVWNLATNQHTQFGFHSEPVKCMHWVEEQQYQALITCSWDKTMKFWDGKSANPMHTNTLSERIYCMDVKNSMCVIATADRKIYIYDLKKPSEPFKIVPSPLKFQTRSISCFPDNRGYAIGSIEGRVGVNYIDDKDNFLFKCHKDNDNCYAVNLISFHPIYGTFATGGADGTLHFWDKDERKRLKQFQKSDLPLSTGCFNKDGSLFAYALSYDWSKGSENFRTYMGKNHILVHPCSDNEVKPKKFINKKGF